MGILMSDNGGSFRIQPLIAVRVIEMPVRVDQMADRIAACGDAAARNLAGSFARSRLRSLLEAQALEWAIPEMKESDLRAAEHILDELDRAESSDDIILLDQKFHKTLYAPARRERTLLIIGTLRSNFERYFRFAWEGASHLGHAQREHREILKCCRNRAAERACVLLRKHIVGTGAPLLQRLKELETAAGTGKNLSTTIEDKP
ncbi:MAG TPA: FCD domain-containing protein [Terriglobales bacterium]|nr:FCD domain-containing protein [Terriglobales bacterium]